jgi:IgA Peptidase M64/von Willebrand factor type A domain
VTTSDGYVGATLKVVDHGPDNRRWNLVVVGDGYRDVELAQYHADVQSFINQLRGTPPFTELWCGINVYRIDVVSAESGADQPATCGGAPDGTGAMPRTYFDTTYCSIGPGGVPISRLLAGNSSLAISVATARVPLRHQVVMLVNSSRYGGSGGPVATASTSAFSIAIHEMGHSAFGLADEYGGNGVGTTAGESPKPNVTRDTNRATNKWRDLILPTTPMPSACGGGCTDCTPPATPPAAGAVGTYEGGDYDDCHVYRPLPGCYMRDYTPFCPVCSRVIRTTLTPYLPPESINPVSLTVSFGGVPEGVGGVGVTNYRAATFEVVSCRRLTFRITMGPTGGFTTPLGTVVPFDQTTTITAVTRLHVWFGYTSSSPGSSSMGTARIHCDETGQDWDFTLSAHTVPRPKSAVVLVLDHSGSMAEDAGDGTTKVQKLREAATIFVDSMLAGDGIGLVRFDDTVQRLMNVTDAGPLGSTTGGRATAAGHIGGPELNPAGATSIGGGVVEGKATLDAAAAAAVVPYDVRAMVVLTDGVENTPPMLSSVASSINANTFAIGLGLPANISVDALNLLTQNSIHPGHTGYLAVTGAITPDQRTLLTKYFLQVLAGITNADIVIDPPGELAPGVTHRIPFDITEADYGLDAFVLTPFPKQIVCALEAPDGTIIDQGNLGAAQLAVRPGLWLYRVALPAVPALPDGTHGGRWHVLLRVSKRWQGHYRSEFAASAKYGGDGLPYDVIVHAYSTLDFAVALTQNHFAPGATVSLLARLTEYLVPLQSDVDVWAEVTAPDGSLTIVSLSPTGEAFEASFLASLPGVYRARVRARGLTTHGSPFTREQTRTALTRVSGGTPPGEDPWCEVLRCLSRNPKLLERLGDDWAELLKCLSHRCRHTPAELERRNQRAG